MNTLVNLWLQPLELQAIQVALEFDKKVVEDILLTEKNDQLSRDLVFIDKLVEKVNQKLNNGL